MSLPQHISLDVRINQQISNAREYLLPFLTEAGGIQPGQSVMEIGCGEGGVLRPVIETGASVLGVDLSEGRIAFAKSQFESEIQSGTAEFITQNVYDESFRVEHQDKFDWILLKDTIEHIPNQERFIPYITQFLKPDGKIFFGFPPWRMPFGGHQQICRSKVLSKLAYVHLLPKPLYAGLISLFGEPASVKQELLELKMTGISLDRFERIIRTYKLEIVAKNLYLINPIYKYKFGLKARKQAKWIAAIPFFRDYVTTCAWYVVGKTPKTDT